MLLLAVIWGLWIPVTKLGLMTMPPLTALRFAVCRAAAVSLGDSGGLLPVAKSAAYRAGSHRRWRAIPSAGSGHPRFIRQVRR
jgi:hypothetical protein